MTASQTFLAFHDFESSGEYCTSRAFRRTFLSWDLSADFFLMIRLSYVFWGGKAQVKGHSHCITSRVDTTSVPHPCQPSSAAEGGPVSSAVKVLTPRPFRLCLWDEDTMYGPRLELGVILSLSRAKYLDK